MIGNLTAEQSTAMARQIQQQLGSDGNEWCRNKDVLINSQQLAILKTGNSTDSALAAVFAPPNVDEYSSSAASSCSGRLFSRGSITSCAPKSSLATRSLLSR